MNKLVLSLALASGLFLAGNVKAAQGDIVQPFSLGYEGWVEAMSDNGNWGLSNPPSNGEIDAYVYRLNIRTGAIDKLPLNDPEQANPDMRNIARNYDISDDGMIIAGEYNGVPAYYDANQGKWIVLPMPKGTRGWSGEVHAMTPDGRIMIGTIYESFVSFRPLVWIDGELKEITNLPDYDEMYELGIIDQYDYEEHKAKGQTPNISFFHISSDGKYIIAGADHNYPAWGASRFVYHLDTDERFWLINDQIKGENFVDEAIMSNNGKYVAGMVHFVDPDPTSFDEYSVPFTYDIPTNKFELGKRGDVIPHIIDNDGNYYLMSGEAPYFSFSVPLGDLRITVDRILKQKFDIDFVQASGCDNTGYPVAVSDDRLTLLCQGDMVKNAYALQLPEPLHVLAEGVNLLTDWQIVPQNNADMARLRTVVLQLSYSSEYDNTKVPVISLNGKEIAKATAVEPAVATKTIYAINFDDVRLEEGNTYTVSIPAEAFYVAGTPFKSEEISVNYKGREEAPLKYTKASPAPGSGMREFGVNNALYLTYNTTIAVTSGAVGQLYEKGSSSPLATLSLANNDNMLAVYPQASRFLNNGTKYIVKVPAGAITDIQGFCGNEPFEIEYEGTYIPEITPTDGTVVFSEDFNNVADALATFLLYEGDHLQPADLPAELGFDQDNTPWNFSTRDDEISTDYFASSHSMYTTSGKSDDWMVIPRMTIKNPDCLLTFKAQNYRKNKADRLKVYAYVCDDVFGSLNKDIVDDMKANATLIFDEKLVPGKDEETCTGDWTDYTVSLKDFYNKNIYLAFVNDNENLSFIFVDDIIVKYDSNYVSGNTTPEVVTAADDVEISGYVINNSADVVYNKIEASVMDSEGIVLDTYTASDINLKKGDTYRYSFARKVPVAKGKANDFEVEVKLDGEVQNYKFSVKNYTEKFQQNFVIEEGTGLWCQACPQGMIAFDYITAQFPGQIIPVAVHQGSDRYAWDTYATFLGFTAFPSGRVNRNPEILFPMNGTAFVSEEGNNTWLDAIINNINNPAEVRVEVPVCEYVEGSNTMAVHVNTDFAIDKTGVHYNAFILVMEDGLVGRQVNGVRDYTDPVYGDWGKNGKYGAEASLDPNGYCVIECDHVARGIAGSSFYGIDNVVPTTVKAGEKYWSKFEFDVPASLKDREKASVLVAIIDAGTGKIVNSTIVHDITTGTGVETIDVTDAKGVSFNQSNGTVYANGSTEGVEIYTVSGQRVANRGLKGLYIARAYSADGTPASVKIVVK